MKRIFVFIGPSTPAAARERFPEFSFQPPVRRGDLLRLLHRNPSVFAIVDGYFSEQPSVLHKEILEAIDEGVIVVGAASMGALRAAELSRLGMIGIGRVFARYERGELTGDDEVALLHSPADMGYRPLSFAVVNLRETLDAAVKQGRLDRETADKIVRLSRELVLSDRRLPVLLRRVMDSDLAEEHKRAAAEVLQGSWVDQKKLDAELLLDELRRGKYSAGDAAAGRTTSDSLRRTCWINLHALHYGFSGVEQVSDMELWAVAKLLVPGYPAFHLKMVRTLWLSQQSNPADCMGRPADAGGPDSIGDDTTGRLEALGIRRTDFLAWARAERQARAAQKTATVPDPRDSTRLRDPFGRLPGRFFVTGLKLSPLYEQTAKLSAEVCAINRQFAARNFGFSHLLIDGDILLKKFMSEASLTPARLREFSNSRGFNNLDDLVYALQLTYLYRTLRPRNTKFPRADRRGRSHRT